MANNQITYLYGSAAPKYEPTPQRRPYREQQPSVRPDVRRRPATYAKPVNVPMILMSIALFAAAALLTLKYISLSSEITALTNGITKLESQVNTLRTENDEYYGRIMSSVDLEEVREVAIMDLGMVYANEEQVITYDAQVEDYVEQSRTVVDN